ncbi:MAG: hypothetical protein M0Q37_10135 [Sphaerochaeta sp.]|nr:hypothetical protein [Sphaerochaeta sp.]
MYADPISPQTTQQPGKRGSMKICNREDDYVNIKLSGKASNQSSDYLLPAHRILHRLHGHSYLRLGR